MAAAPRSGTHAVGPVPIGCCVSAAVRVAFAAEAGGSHLCPWGLAACMLCSAVLDTTPGSEHASQCLPGAVSFCHPSVWQMESFVGLLLVS